MSVGAQNTKMRDEIIAALSLTCPEPVVGETLAELVANKSVHPEVYKELGRMVRAGIATEVSKVGDNKVRFVKNRLFILQKDVHKIDSTKFVPRSAPAVPKPTAAPARGTQLEDEVRALREQVQRYRKEAAVAEEKTVSANRTAQYYRKILVETYKHDLGDVIDLTD